MKVHDWSKRVIKNLFVMMVVDEWLDFNGCMLAEDNKKEFYTLLVEKLIDNSFDNPNMALQS